MMCAEAGSPGQGVASAIYVCYIMLIYPFHKFETNKSSVTRAQVVQDVFARACQEFGLDIEYTKRVQEFIGDFNEYANIYGYEATCLSFLLHPVANKITLNKADAFAAWKIINRVWTLLSKSSIRRTDGPPPGVGDVVVQSRCGVINDIGTLLNECDVSVRIEDSRPSSANFACLGPWTRPLVNSVFVDAVISLQRQKLHTYVSCLTRIVKKTDQVNYDGETWQYILAIIKSFFPLLYEGFVKMKNESACEIK